MEWYYAFILLLGTVCLGMFMGLPVAFAFFAANVLGTALQPCSYDPMTGYYRTGCCEHHGDDPSMHVVCCRVTDDFLAFSQSRGNDLVTPVPAHGFPGLKGGDRWCLCAARWQEALETGMAPWMVMRAAHFSATRFAQRLARQHRAL